MRAARAAGWPVEAERILRSLTDDYRGLHHVAPAAAMAREIADSKVHRRQVDERTRTLRDEKSYVDSAQRILATESSPRPRHRAAWHRAASNANRRFGPASARRAVRRDPFYLPREMMERKDYGRALLFLTVAETASPEDPRVECAIAAAHAMHGNKNESIHSLQKSFEKRGAMFEVGPDAPPKITRALLEQLLDCPDCRGAVLEACNSEERESVDIDAVLLDMGLSWDH